MPKFSPKKVCGWGIGVNKQVVVYDDSFGAMAVRAWWMLLVGHPGVALLDGGMPKWQREKRELTTEVPEPVKGHCACLPEPTQIVSVQEVLQAVSSGEQLIIDARPERRFTLGRSSSRLTRLPAIFPARSTGI